MVAWKMEEGKVMLLYTMGEKEASGTGSFLLYKEGIKL
jgi:hypothetical protein